MLIEILGVEPRIELSSRWIPGIDADSPGVLLGKPSSQDSYHFGTDPPPPPLSNHVNPLQLSFAIKAASEVSRDKSNDLALFRRDKFQGDEDDSRR